MTAGCLDQQFYYFLLEITVIRGSTFHEQAVRGIGRAIGNALLATPGSPNHNESNVTFPSDSASINGSD